MEISYPCTCKLNESVDAAPQTVELKPGKYLVEIWGASGGCNTKQRSGKGAYVWIRLNLVESKNFTLFVGGTSTYSNITMVKGGCNGGGDSYQGNLKNGESLIAGGGGGSTSIGLSLFDPDRIAVAAGGGGCGRTGDGGNAGGLVGSDGTGILNSNYRGLGASQDGPGKGGWGYIDYRAEDGKIKKGGNGIGEGFNGGGGGGGYYGGGGSYEAGGGGGSSYKKSGYYGLIQSGSEIFRSPEGINEEGHYGNGFARIKFISYSCVVNIFNRNIFPFDKFFFIFLVS